MNPALQCSSNDPTDRRDRGASSHSPKTFATGIKKWSRSADMRIVGLDVARLISIEIHIKTRYV